MAVTFSLDIEKENNNEFWTNRYFLDNPSIESALLSAASIIAAERAVHATGINFTRYRVSDIDPSTDIFVIVPIGETGEREITSVLPLFNVVRVDFPAGLGRPSRKYLRVGISEEDNDAGSFTSGFLATISSDYCAALDAVSTFVDPQGTPLGTGIPFPKVAMRQLRRGSRRRTTPVIP